MGQIWRSYMAAKKFSTQFPGVRYREHKSRIHNRKLDRYFFIRYRIDGKLKEEAIGWASEGWNATRASGILSELREAHRTGDGPQTLEEKRRLENEKREAEIFEKKRKEKDQLTFGNYFDKTYFPTATANKKEWSWKREKSEVTPSDCTKNYRVLRLGRRLPEGEEKGPYHETQTLHSGFQKIDS